MENIYFFVAQAFACLGNRNESLSYLLKIHQNEKDFSIETNKKYLKNRAEVLKIIELTRK